MTVDSDTILDENALSEISRVFNDPDVGVATGNIKVKNKNDNLLTRCISAWYWTSFEIDRKSNSRYGYLQVCSGALACYRKQYVLALKDRYINQKFLGSKCSIGDDRWLTMNVQRCFGCKGVYVSNAIAYTYTPNRLLPFMKQIIRWKQSVIRESLLTFKDFGKKKLMSGEVVFIFVLRSLITLIKIWIIFAIVFYDWRLLFDYIGYIVWSSAFMNCLMLLENLKEFPFRILFSVLDNTILWVRYPIAMLLIKRQDRWITRRINA